MKPYYEHAGITIYHGDCREALASLSGVDLVATDPPYGIKEDSFRPSSRTKLGATRDYGKFDWDVAPDAWVIAALRNISKHQIIFGGNYFELPPSRCWLVWDKDNRESNYADAELAWTSLDKAVQLLTWRWNGMLQEDMANKEARVHPTQKPLAVMKWAIKQAPDECRLILDPFMGSGTTLRAAKDLGRAAIGVEINEKYCEIAATRLSQEVMAFR